MDSFFFIGLQQSRKERRIRVLRSEHLLCFRVAGNVQIWKPVIQDLQKCMDYFWNDTKLLADTPRLTAADFIP